MAIEPGEEAAEGRLADEDREITVPEPEERTETALPPRVERWRKRSATGAMLTGLAFGLREALEPERREPSIVLETSGLPPGDLPVEADLEDGRPKSSSVTVRRWLLTGETVEVDPALPEAATTSDSSETAGDESDPRVSPEPGTERDRVPTAVPQRGQRSTLAGRNKRPAPPKRRK